MRTTLDLPDDLLRRAKIAAVERGTTLREFVGQALSRELDLNSEGATRSPRVRFPIFESKAPGTLKVAPEDLSRIEAEEDDWR
ncbi:MAG: hypothetical protein AB7J34_17020 [Limisphaerales bacterium]